jgi:hypothetical protein
LRRDRYGRWSILRLALVLTPIAVAGALYVRGFGAQSVAPEAVRAAVPPPAEAYRPSRGRRSIPN